MAYAINITTNTSESFDGRPSYAGGKMENGWGKWVWKMGSVENRLGEIMKGWAHFRWAHVNVAALAFMFGAKVEQKAYKV